MILIIRIFKYHKGAFDMSEIPVIGITIAIGVILLIVLTALTWKKAPQDKAIVVTGLKKRVITGAGGIVIPFFEQAHRISLENIKVEVRTTDSLDSNGVPIDTDGVVIVKVKSQKDSILQAMEQFNTGKEKETIAVIQSTVQDVLEGKLREVVSKLSVEEIYSDRQRFADQVEDIAKADLERMGLDIKTFTIRDIDDKNGYLQSLGVKQIAKVKKDAAIAQAEADREKMEKTAEAMRRGKEAQLLAETEIAKAEKEKGLKVQAYKEEQKKAEAKADFAYEVEKNIVQKQVIQAQKDAELFEEQKQTQIAEQQVIKKEKELEATIKKVAEADKYKTEKKAEADRFEQIKKAEAEAEAIRIKSMAEAESIRLKGQATADAMKAEADAMKEKAEAYKQYGDAAIIEMLAQKLPEIAKYIAEPLSKTEKIIVIDNGGDGGASKISKSVTNIMSQVPEVVDALTGINLLEVIKNVTNKGITEKMENNDNKIEI
ncbi:MAG: flotillin [Clostridia bacterium]|jgi:flotillin|nr:flotillin [Clostridia bacterium]